MSTFELSRMFKALIIVSTLLIAPLAQVVWAREERGKGEQRGNAEQRQQKDKAPAQSRNQPSSRPAEVARRETTRGNSPPSGPSMNEQIQRTPQALQREITSPRSNQPDSSGPQIRQKPSPGPQVSSPARQFNATKPSSEENRSTFRINTVPSGVEVRRPTSVNPSGQQQVNKPDAGATQRPKPEIGRQIGVPSGRTQESRDEATPRPRVKPEPVRNERDFTRIVSPQPVSKPTPERGRDGVRNNNDGRISPIAVPREKPEPGRNERVATRIVSPQPVSKPTPERGRDNGRNNNDGRISPIAVSREKPAPSSEPETGVSTRPERTVEQSRDRNGLVGRGREDTRDSTGRQENWRTRSTDRQDDSRTSKGPRLFGRSGTDNVSRPSRDIADNRVDFVRSHRRTVAIGSGDHDFRRFRPATTTRVNYEDRISAFGHRHHNNFVFRDRRHLLINRIIWPRYYYPVYYNWGHQYSFHYVYPFYQRRYIFVSLGGFWPDYSCVRYYWYPTHYYGWYGYAPVAYEVPGDTYNYYTYNYYPAQSSATTYYGNSDTGLTPVDSNTFADVREKLSREQKGPDAQTTADTLFDEGVKAFGQGGYTEAADKFAAAMKLAPEDMILPFAYAQALFAQGFYSQAADVLRTALQKVTPDKEGVYYPRGLYLDENTLDEQIDQLTKAAEAIPNDSDLQLLLGYHWLGIGETEKSIEPLAKAKEDYKNFGAASTLLELAGKIKAGETQ